MELSQYVEGLRRELGSLTRFAPDEVTEVAQRLAEALDSSVRLTLLEVLSAAAAEITTKLDETVIDVRLSSGEPEFVVTPVPVHPAEQASGPVPDLAADEAGTARVTLRLSEALKSRVEERAAAEGLSVNSWLVHAAIRALDGKASSGGGYRVRESRSGIGQRITGYARS